MKTLHEIAPVLIWPIWVRNGEHCPDPGCETDYADNHHHCLQRFAGLPPRLGPGPDVYFCECDRCWSGNPKHYFTRTSHQSYTCPPCTARPCPEPPR